jgi:FkbM family methyltransferase
MNHFERRKRIIETRNITVVLDVGANKGQFALETRQQLNYSGRIVSFEPLSSAFEELRARAASDQLWECRQFGLSNSRRSAHINISENSHSSSLLNVSPRSLTIEPSIRCIGREQIQLHRLDAVWPEFCNDNDRVYLKIDAQGHEMAVLDGARAVLPRVSVLQIETSFLTVYEEEVVIDEMIQFLYANGFKIVGIEPGWEDGVTGEMLQADLLLVHA